MDGVTVFVAAFAMVCAVVCGMAVVAVWKAKNLTRKPLWILGCLLGFVGFAVDPSDGDLLLLLGVQIPVVSGIWSSGMGLTLKASFPIIALFALAKAEI